MSSSDAASDSETETSAPDHAPVIEDLTFTVPPSFKKVKPSKAFPTDLKKKEIWLIKAPRGFNLKELKTLPVSFNPISGGEQFSNSGKTFSIHEDLTNLGSLAEEVDNSKKGKKKGSKNPKTDSKYTLITPRGTGGEFQFNKHLKISRLYNVVETVKIPEIKYENVVEPRKDVRVVKGLKPQHFATGYDMTTEDVCTDDEEEEEVAEPAVKKQKLEKAEKKEKKEKKDKKEKKEKKDKKKEKKEKK